MAMSRYDYEQQHISDVKRIKEQSITITEQAKTIEELTVKLNRVIEASTKIFTVIMNDINGKPEAQIDKKAGRKSKLTDGVIQAVKLYRDEGMTQKEIAEAIGISVGLVNKACNLPSRPQA